MTPNKSEFKGRHLAIMFLCFFGVIITVNFSMAYIAVTNWTGLVVKNSYVASQDFNRDLEAAKRQKLAGWSSDISYDAGTLEFNLKDANKKPVSATKVSAKIGRPAFEQLDHEVVFSTLGTGEFKVNNPLGPGPWRIVVSAEIEGQPYRRDVRLFVTSAGKGIIE